MKLTKFVLTLMILASLFGGFKVKMWSFLYQFELDFPTTMMPHATFYEIFIWCILVLSHMVIFSLPFMVSHQYFRRLLIVAPIIFTCCYLLFSIFFAFYLIPFIILWVTALQIERDQDQKGSIPKVVG